MTSYAKIQGHDLVRDMTTGAVLNTNKSEYDYFIEKKLKEKHANEKINDLEAKVKELQDIVSSYSAMFENAKDLMRKK